MDVLFEWDPNKDRSNKEKHRVGFAEASTVFADPLGQILPDPEHSTYELREIIVGQSWAKRLLLVCFAELDANRIRSDHQREARDKERTV